LPTVPHLLILGSFKAIIIAQWAQESPDIIKSQNTLPTDGKSSGQIIHIWSWDYFTQVLQYQDFWIINSYIKGILLYNASISCENIFIFFATNSCFLLKCHTECLHAVLYGKWNQTS